MIESEWGDWLVRAVEQASPEGVAIWYLGCNGFVLKGHRGTTIFIDPYLGNGDPPRTIRMIPVPFEPDDVTEADAILTTHEHIDHIHGPSQAPILENTDAMLYGSSGTLEVAREKEDWTSNWEVSPSQFVEVAKGDSFEVGEFIVHAEEASDPDTPHAVTYVIEHDRGTIFHAGDSQRSTELSYIGDKYDIDLGILALGTEGYIPDEDDNPAHREWYNNENQIIKAANDLRVERLLPSHWDMWKGVGGDPTVLHHHKRSYEYPKSLEIIEIGDRIRL
jgi:L-ascorbate 6-phosphate lactonase